MAGIVAYGAYLPKLRLGSGTRGYTGRNERPVANFDEDTITMSVAAVRDCLNGRDRAGIDALFFGSTTAPYLEKQSASLIATAADLPTGLFAADIAHSLRAGTMALRMALDSVTAGSARTALVAAGDQRLGAPASDIETATGDGAAALLLGGANELARIVDHQTVLNDILDVWRDEGERMIRTAPDRFRFDDGFLYAVTQATQALLDRRGQKITDFHRVVIAAPDQRRHTEAIRALGADPKNVAPDRFDRLGNTGSAHALSHLVAALEEAQPGQRLLLVDYGDGASAYILETTPELAAYHKRPPRGVAAHLANRMIVGEYDDYLRWRGLYPTNGDDRWGNAPAPSALYREAAEITRFHAAQCQSCQFVAYPPQRVCPICTGRDTGAPFPLAARRARLFSYSKDYVAQTPDRPLIHSVVDFDTGGARGGRAMMMMTDRDENDVRIGMDLEPAFRKLRHIDGIHTYLWKVTPIRA